MKFKVGDYVKVIDQGRYYGKIAKIEAISVLPGYFLETNESFSYPFYESSLESADYEMNCQIIKQLLNVKE